MAVQITLTQGAIVIATRTVSSLTGSFTDYSFNLTGPERSRITDLHALTLTFAAGAAGESVAYARVEVTGETQASARLTEDEAAYRVTEDGAAYRITEGTVEPGIVEPIQAAFFAVF